MGKKSDSEERNIRRTLYIKPELQVAGATRADDLNLGGLSAYVEHLIERDLRRAGGKFDFPPSRVHEKTIKSIKKLEQDLAELTRAIDFDS